MKEYGDWGEQHLTLDGQSILVKEETFVPCKHYGMTLTTLIFASLKRPNQIDLYCLNMTNGSMGHLFQKRVFWLRSPLNKCIFLLKKKTKTKKQKQELRLVKSSKLIIQKLAS